MSRSDKDAPVRGAVTIRQLAALAGVSRTTVSLALRNDPCVKVATRRRIRDLADEWDYRSDTVVSSLMNRLRTRRVHRNPEILAYLTSWDKRDSWMNVPNEQRFYNGIRERASKLGFRTEVVWAKDPQLSAKSLSRILYNRSIRGLILAPLLRSSGHFSLQWQHFASAAIGFTLRVPAIHRATHSHLNGMVLALRKLKQRGYQCVGFVNHVQQNDRVGNNWLAGYLMYQHVGAYKKCVPPLMVKTWNVADFRTWLRKYRPDAVISNSVEPFEMLERLKIRVPEEIGFASLDRVTIDWPFAGIDQYPERIGMAAVNLVVSQLQNNEYGLPSNPHTLQLDGRWVDGPSIRAH